MDVNKKVVDALKEIFPKIDKLQGMVLWGLVVNTDVTMPDGTDVSGSFRWWGARIADVTGEGNYLTYYMSSTFLTDIDDIERELMDKLQSAGWTLKEYITYCSKCGGRIGKWEPKALNIKEGNVYCVDCMVDNNEEEMGS